MRLSAPTDAARLIVSYQVWWNSHSNTIELDLNTANWGRDSMSQGPPTGTI
jgi:hypothetical protein